MNERQAMAAVHGFIHRSSFIVHRSSFIVLLAISENLAHTLPAPPCGDLQRAFLPGV
jgi:hypothetical protein